MDTEFTAFVKWDFGFRTEMGYMSNSR